MKSNPYLYLAHFILEGVDRGLDNRAHALDFHTPGEMLALLLQPPVGALKGAGLNEELVVFMVFKPNRFPFKRRNSSLWFKSNFPARGIRWRGRNLLHKIVHSALDLRDVIFRRVHPRLQLADALDFLQAVQQHFPQHPCRPLSETRALY